MGSGSSSQVKAIETKTSSPIATDDKQASLNNEPSRTPIKKKPQTSVKEDIVPPTFVMPMNPSPSTSQPSKSVQSMPQPQPPASVSQYELEQKVEQLQKELNESESEKLDLNDRIQALEERVQELMSASEATKERGGPSDGSQDIPAANLQETLHAKDSYIQQMERQLTALETESKKVRVRLKKKIKMLTGQLNEAKQESSIAQLELKEHNAELQEQLRHSSQGKPSIMAGGSAEVGDGEGDPKLKIILDLSAEVSEQANRIAGLERKLKEKDKEIEVFRKEAARTPRQAAPPDSMEPAILSTRSQSSSQLLSSRSSQHGSQPRQVTFSGAVPQSGVPPVESVRDYDSVRNQRPISKIGPRSNPSGRVAGEFTLQRQSTALSDSDSDWEVDLTSSKNHSAPARMRVKSAVIEERSSSQIEGEDKWSIATDDNDLIPVSDSRVTRGNSGKNKRKSALKARLERDRNERAKGLLGPSLAFTAPAHDQLSDTSCTPTPRRTVLDSKFTTSDVMAFAV